MTPAEAAEFTLQDACSHCGGWHARACPRVRRMVFNPDGRLIEVEFWKAGEWPVNGIVWPEDVAAAAADGEDSE